MNKEFKHWLSEQKYDYFIRVLESGSHNEMIFIKNVYIEYRKDFIFSLSDGDTINYFLNNFYTWEQILIKLYTPIL